MKKLSYHDAKQKRASAVADEEAIIDFLKARPNLRQPPALAGWLSPHAGGV